MVPSVTYCVRTDVRILLRSSMGPSWRAAHQGGAIGAVMTDLELIHQCIPKPPRLMPLSSCALLFALIRFTGALINFRFRCTITQRFAQLADVRAQPLNICLK